MWRVQRGSQNKKRKIYKGITLDIIIKSNRLKGVKWATDDIHSYKVLRNENLRYTHKR